MLVRSMMEIYESEIDVAKIGIAEFCYAVSLGLGVCGASAYAYLCIKEKELPKDIKDKLTDIAWVMSIFSVLIFFAGLSVDPFQATATEVFWKSMMVLFFATVVATIIANLRELPSSVTTLAEHASSLIPPTGYVMTVAYILFRHLKSWK